MGLWPIRTSLENLDLKIGDIGNFFVLPYTEVIPIETSSTVQSTSVAAIATTSAAAIATSDEGDFGGLSFISNNESPIPSAQINHSTHKSCTRRASPPTQDVSSSLLDVIDEEEEIELQDEPVAKRTRLDSEHRLNVTFTVGQTQNDNSTHLDFTSH